MDLKEEAAELAKDLRTMASRLEAISYYTFGRKMRNQADELEQVFVREETTVVVR